MNTQAETTKQTETTKPQKNAKKVARRGRTEKKPTKEQGGKVRGAEESRTVVGGGAAALVSRRETELAFTQRRHEIDAMPATGLGRITIAIPAAVTIALGALPNIEAKQKELREHLPKYDHVRAGRLREYAYAAVHAHYRVVLASEGEVRLGSLLAEAAPLRERLLRSAELHAHYGVLDADHVAAIRRGTGHLDTANDLAQLALLFRRSFGKLEGKTPVTEADVSRAATLGDELLEALGKRRIGTDGASTPGKEEEDRVKAFWLFHGVYEESRRAMAHLRWYEGDAHVLVPSLFVSHRRRTSSAQQPRDDEGPGDPVDSGESD